MSKDINLHRISVISIAAIFIISFSLNIAAPVLELPSKLVSIGMFIPLGLMLLSCLAYFRTANNLGVVFGFAAGIVLVLIYLIARSNLDIHFGQILFLAACLFALGYIGILEKYDDSDEEKINGTVSSPQVHGVPEKRLLEERVAPLLEKVEYNGDGAETQFPILRARFQGISDRYSDQKLVQLIRKNYEQFFKGKSDEELIDLVEEHLSKKEHLSL